MTGIDLETKGAHADSGTRTRRKSVLFCPVCGHEGAVDGHWQVVPDEGTEALVCPVCDGVVAVR